MIVTENQLDEWVRGNARDAQGTIVELVWRLVAASAPAPRERRFPLGDSIGQHGPDGILDTAAGMNPFVPEGRSFWEIGTGLNAGAKATSDYNDLVSAVPEDVRRQSTFVFVTPLSGRRDWQHTWKEDAQAEWLQVRRGHGEWLDVRLIDGTGLIDWLHQFPAVEIWLAQRLGMPSQQIETIEQRWELLRTLGAPPPLTPLLFLANRGNAIAKLRDTLIGNTLQLKLDTHFPDQVVDFIAACVVDMDEEHRVDVLGRCLVISGPEAMNTMISQRERLVLVADFDLDESNATGTRLLAKARRAGHAVIFGGVPGGVPHANRELIPSPKVAHVRDALQKAGYSDERARTLAQKSDGNLGTLLRCLQNLSIMPEWAQHSDAAELAIAELLGAWDERSPGDVAAVEGLLGKSYGEWIGEMRKLTLRPGTPLTHRDGLWKFISRYEGWYALGSSIFDDHLGRLQGTAMAVLAEPDPRFGLSPDERFAAAIHGKAPRHSSWLRKGLAETLAMLGTHHRALTSSSVGIAEATAFQAVRQLLSTTDWVLWASLNDVLPLLAEAAPDAFLDAVEKTLNASPCPFDQVFEQEGTGLGEGNHMTGLLWALETLGWDGAYLTRVVVLLGELAARDPGGNWANRPAHSLTTMLLPWRPQTCASMEKRRIAVTTLVNTTPEVAWALLISLLPRSTVASSGTRRPAWRDMIADDWPEDVSSDEYSAQIAVYAEIAIACAKREPLKLAELMENLEDLPPPAQEQVLAHINSDEILESSEDIRMQLWSALTDLIAKHRRFADADWAMAPGRIGLLTEVTERLAPRRSRLWLRSLFRQRDYDPYDETRTLQEQQAALDARRREAIEDVIARGGIAAVLDLAGDVESPWRLGFVLGDLGSTEADRAILPAMLGADKREFAQLAEGFVRGRFRHNQWMWADELNLSGWRATQIGEFMSYMPFSPETWARVARLMNEDEGSYWTKVHANPYELDQRSLEVAVRRLIEHRRPQAAIQCLDQHRRKHEPLDVALVVDALLAAVGSSEPMDQVGPYRIVELIRVLQLDPNTKPEDMFSVEWAYLPLLSRREGPYPTLLRHGLATEPAFFCKVISLVFRSKHEAPATDGENSSAESVEETRAANAYRLLREWRSPPGVQSDGSYDGNALHAWLDEVKRICTQSGHLEIAMTFVGHVLTYSPPDPDGLWIHRAAAGALNERDAGDMRDGFRTELFNSRGVHGFTAGGEEHELSTKYQARAEEVEAAGYHRLAATLSGLAASYERQAEREASRDPFDER